MRDLSEFYWVRSADFEYHDGIGAVADLNVKYSQDEICRIDSYTITYDNIGISLLCII